MGADQDVDAVSFDASPTNPSGPVTGPVRARGTPRPALFDEATARRELAPALLEENAPLDRDATERALLAAIATGDEGSRLVYADWLEERSEHARAGYLRLEQLVSRLAPSDPRIDACTRQLRELMQHIDAGWRARVARPPIEGCPAFDFRCPKRWDALALTDQATVRHCGTCAKHVHYFENVDDAREAAREGHCVAIGLGSERWEDDFVDIGTRCWSCSRRIVSNARFCPHCGAGLHRTTVQMEVEVEMGLMRRD
jgi:uncharacterized protein (TIGR02996 family)